MKSIMYYENYIRTFLFPKGRYFLLCIYLDAKQSSQAKPNKFTGPIFSISAPGYWQTNP